MYTRAIIRPPAPNFAGGLTTAQLGAPDYQLALAQHVAYGRALEMCGLELIELDPDPDYPDSTFVEDPAVIFHVLPERQATAPSLCAVITNPGAQSRVGEIQSMRIALANLFTSLAEIKPPGTLDGGDVCQAGDHFFIGISERTNENGAQQFAALVAPAGYTSTLVDIRTTRDALLHLKSGLAYLGSRRLAVTQTLRDCPEFAGFDLIEVAPEETYAANCVRINEYVLVASGFPKLEASFGSRGYQTMTVDMSEFQKMDGGLSCLSLRF